MTFINLPSEVKYYDKKQLPTELAEYGYLRGQWHNRKYKVAYKAKIIAHPANLRLIKAGENQVKNRNSEISILQLKQAVSKF